MSQPAKFTFERRFSERRANPFQPEEKEATVPMSQHLAALAAAALAARAEGVAQGRAETEASEAARLARALEAVCLEAKGIAAAIDAIEAAAMREAVHFAGLFAAKLAGELLAKAPVESMAAAARAVMQDLRGAPHLAARVPPDLVDLAHARLGAMLRERGLETKLVVLGDPAVTAGGITLDWADGGLVKDFASAAAAANAAAARLAAEIF